MKSTNLYGAIYKLLPFFGFHHVLMLLSTFAIVLSAIVLAGCTNSRMSTVYLMSLSYARAGHSSSPTDPSQVNSNISSAFASLSGSNTSLEVRVGYMGLCIHDATQEWICSKSAETLANLVRGSNLGNGGDRDPLNLIWIGNNFKKHIVFDGLIFASIPLIFLTILILASFPGWHDEVDEDGSEREVKPFPSKRLIRVALGFVVTASLFSFISILWQHIASSAAAFMGGNLSYGAVDGHVGTLAMVLGWAGVFLSVLLMVALLSMIMSFRVLEEALGGSGNGTNTSMSLVDD